ncbi:MULTISPECIES: TetR/AcrR family transcriptional regulator [unclassified Brevibacterium]|uniref:TetR/AcrR family transcriptional regulator n=1 Tax=unclassified Brevibacterium TaxID=2614124 RepID=UPI001091D1EE|nr:TetR/AcrR family transcriptional regulator [Brevibacterium sp. S22]
MLKYRHPPALHSPSNRRELILVTANDLLSTRGFEHVVMGDVAEAVAIGPSALYRTFRPGISCC